jgi:hypothetical protein
MDLKRLSASLYPRKKSCLFMHPGVLVILVILSGPVFAHHGASAYDREKPLTLKATITSFEWVNPHTQIYFDATDSKGNVVHWNCESINPGMLAKQGWTRHTLKPGDQVTIIGSPAKSGTPVMLLQELILANGQKLQGRLLN